MANIKGITIELGLSDKSVQKLRAIAKHAESLANELDSIDNAFECPECGGLLRECRERKPLSDIAYEETNWYECTICNFDSSVELPTQPEVSE